MTTFQDLQNFFKSGKSLPTLLGKPNVVRTDWIAAQAEQAANDLSDTFFEFERQEAANDLCDEYANALHLAQLRADQREEDARWMREQAAAEAADRARKDARNASDRARRAAKVAA